MRRPDAQRVVSSRGSFRQGSSQGAYQLSWCFVSVLSCAALLPGCDSRKSTQPAEANTAIAGSSGQHSDGESSEQHSEHNHGSSATGPGAQRPAGPPAIALNPEVRGELTTVSVSAHVGSVIIRKEGSAWVMPGRNGCSVPLARIERAFDNLAQLRAASTNQPVPDGSAFRLQISLLIGEERTIHLEVADRNEDGDLARLENDSMVRVQGLDRGLWSPHPVDWCHKP